MRTIKFFIVVMIALGSSNLFAQKYGATPEDSVECIKNLSLYQEFYKQRNYADAYEPWFWVYNHCPQNHVNTFIRGVNIVKTKISKETDVEQREKYIDLLLDVWDKRGELFGSVGFCKGRKAVEVRTYRPNETAQIYELFKEAMTLGFGDKEYAIPFFYFESAMANEKAGNLTKEDVLEAYDIASTRLEHMLQINRRDTNILKAMENLDIAFIPYASCEEIIPLYEKKYEENKNNVEFLEKVCKVLDRKDCNDSELFFNATEALHALKPTAATAYLMAKMCDGKKMYDKVVEYLGDDVINQMENERDQIRAYLLMAKAYLNLSKFSDGRNAARKALEINPKEGKAYILIGHLYAQSAKICGDEPLVAQKAAYWAAVDKFQQAKNVDPNVAEEADKLSAAYRAQYPSGDDIFMMGFTEGSPYKVECWIQENTTIRKRP